MSSDIDSNPGNKHQETTATLYKVFFKEYASSLFSFVARMLKSDRKSENSRANNDSFSTMPPSKCVSAKQKEQVIEQVFLCTKIWPIVGKGHSVG